MSKIVDDHELHIGQHKPSCEGQKQSELFLSSDSIVIGTKLLPQNGRHSFEGRFRLREELALCG